MRKLTLFIATLLLTVAKTVAFEVSTLVDNPEHLYFITNGNNEKVGKNAVNSNEAGRFAFYAVEDEDVDNAYYIYSLDEKKWFDYEMKASYGGTKNFVKLSSEKGNYFVIESCEGNTAYYQIRPYNSTGVASIYLNYFQGADGRNTIGLWTADGDEDGGSRWNFIEAEEVKYSLTDKAGNTYEWTSLGIVGVNPTLPGAAGATFEGTWDGNECTATINFPFPVSKEGGDINATTIASVNQNKKWRATDNEVIMVQTSDYDANDNDWLWAIYPQFDNGAFSFKIKSLGKDKWIYTEATGSKVDGGDNDDSAGNAAGAVTLADNGTAFDVVLNGSNYGFHYKVGNNNQYLSINSRNDTKVYLGVHTGLHVGSDVFFNNVKTISPVAQVGDVVYYTLAEAVAAAQAGDEIVVIAEVAGETVDVTKNLTISGAATLNNVGINANGADTLTVEGLTFTGNSWINSGTAEALTVSGITASVAPSNTSYTNSRSAFISLGRSEGQELALTVENSNITVTAAGADAILGWAKITAATITGNVIKGSNDGYFTNADAIKFMSIADGAEFVVNNNEIYSNYNGIVFAQNTTRDNAYSVSADANKFYGGADHIWIEITGGNTVHAPVNATSANTVNGNAFTINDIKYHSGVIKTWSSYAGVDVVTNENGKVIGGTLAAFSNAESVAEGYEIGTNGVVGKASVAEVNGVKYASFADAAEDAQAGDEIKLLANIEGDITVPAGVKLNGNGFAISGGITAAGEITFAGVTKAKSFNVENTNTVVNIPAGASVELTGGRMVIGHGCTFNITGSIAENAAKTTDKATLTPSLVMPGASFTGAGVTFNVTNAYISAPSSYCSSSKSASGTFDFNINNSIWENAGKFAFESQSTAATVNFDLVESVLNTGSHLVFGVSRGEVVIDNSNVNVGKSNQIENQSTMTIKNGSVVNGAVATSSNAKNPGTVIVDNATYAVTGEFSGSDLGTGTLIIKKDANVSVGSIKAGANVTVDAEGMAAGDEINFTANLSGFTGTLSVINNDNLEASIVDGKVVLAAKPAAKIGEQGYATLEAAFVAAAEDATITLLADATPALTSQRAITKAAVIDLNGKTMTLTEDDLYFGTTTFKNGTIVVDPSVKPSTAVFWMFANQTLTFDNVKIVATGVTGTYLIGLDGNNSDLNLLNGSEILVENTTALDLDIICVNASTGNDIKVENSKVNVTNLDGRVFFRGNYTVKDSEVNLAGITKAGFRIEAGQTLSIEGTSQVNIEGELRDGGIHMTDLTATYTKAETATVNATVNEPKVAKVGENTYRTLALAVAAVEDGGTITLIANETFTKTNRTHNSGTWYDGLYYVGDKSFTIDLGGFTISQDGAVNDYLLNFKNSGSKANTITLKNGTIDAGTAAFCAICTSSSQANDLTINTENINIINNISDGSTIKLRGGAVLNVKTGTVITGKNSYLGIECVASTVNIYDGAEIYMNGTSSYNGCLVGACAAGTVNVYGGYGKGVKGGFIAMTSGGTINVAGGEWIANTDGTVGNNSNLYVLTAQSNKNESGFAGPSIINVTGGTFRGGMDAWVLNNVEGEKAELNISGGNFNANPTSYVAEGCAALPNLDGGFVVGAAPTATVNNLGMTIVAAGEYSIWDGSFDQNTEDDGDMPLSFVMQFLADQDGEDMANSPYADWYGDFVLTFTGLENGSFTADGCYLAGHYGSFGWVKVPVDGMTIEDGARYPVMLGVGLGQKYDYICSSVEDFKCALYLTPEILEANPNIQVNLELAVVDNSQGSDAAASALVNNENVYSVTDYTYNAEDFVSGLTGEGTAASPYLIKTVKDLILFRNSVNAGNNYQGKFVKLTADIDLNNEEWTPIGNVTYDSKYKPTDASKVFSGVFNGNGKVISNLKVASTVGGVDTEANVGLFGITGEGAVIKDLTLTNVNIETDGRNVGALAGFAYKATLSNITVNGNIQIKGGNNVAGVAGMTRYYDMSATGISVIGNDGSAIVGNNIVGGIFAEIAPNGSEQKFDGLNVENVAITGVGGVGGIVGLLTTGAVENVSVKNVVLTGRTDYQGNAMGRIRLGSVAGLMGGQYATIANEAIDNVTAKNLDGDAVELPVIGANYDAASNATEAKIGNKYYATLAGAFTAVGDGAGKTVELIADVDLAGAEWTPVTFNGVFDGQNHTISNLVVNGAGKSNQGFFAQTQNGEIKNVTFNNAEVTGRLNVGVVAGTPYTSKYTNVKVTGHVEVNGMAYVGGVGGKNAYANWTDITVDVDDDSYVKATSTENGTAYRTYVGGVIGFNGEGGHTFKNISSNIKVIGDVMDIGGIFGILHYGNNAEDITFTGAVEAPAGAKEVGGIAGVWHNAKGQVVTITNANSEGDVKVGDVTTTGSIVGGAYNAANQSPETSGSLKVDGKEVWVGLAKVGEVPYETLAAAVAAAQAGETVTLLADINLSEILVLDKAITLDGNNKTLTSTAGRAINVSGADGVTIKNLTINASGERAINVIQNATNVTIDGVTATAANYTVNVASSAPAAVVAINNSTLNGLCTVNVAAAGAVVTIDNSTVNCNDNDTTVGEAYAALSLNKDAVGGSIVATNTTVNVAAGSDSKKGRNSAENGTVSINGSTDDVAVMVAVITYEGSAYYYSFATLAEAIEYAKAGDVVTLIRDVTINELVKIEKAITLDLNDKKVTSTAKKAFEVHADATIKNGTIEAAQRCVDTRKAVELTLTDVTLIADEYTTHGNPQPLTIGGSENGTKVVMTNVNISAAAGYGIITFVETELTATNSTIGGYNALYVKPGSDNSTFNFVDSDLSGSTVGNDVEGNSFSTIAVRANNVAVNVDAESTVTANGNYSFAISFIGGSENTTTGSSVTVAGDITGNILDEPNGNTVKVKAEYADELAAAGYATIEAENGLVAAIKAVVAIDGKGYASLAAAITAAQANDVITFLTDINESVTVSKNVTIDGADKKYTGTMTGNAGLNVTVQNVNFVNGGFDKSTKNTTGTYTIKDCTFDGAGTYAYAFRFKGANKVVVENCTVRNYLYSFLYVTSGTNTVSVKNVTVDNCPSYAVYFSSGVNNAMFENLTVKNSNNGFVINNTANRAFTMKNCKMENVTTAINHSGGTNTITCTALGVNDLGTAALSEYAVIKGATIEGSNLYGSVQGMVAKAENGQTVKLLSDIALNAAGYEMASCDGYPSFVHVEGKAITVDLNGKTIDADVDAADVSNFVVGVFSTDNGGELTLVDNSAEGTGKVILDAEEGKVYSLLCNYEDGCKMTINGGTYVANKVRDCLVYSGGKTDALVTVNGGNFTLGNVGTGENGKPWIFNVLGAGDHHVLVNGGTFNADINRQHWSNEVVVPETHYTVANADGTYTVEEGAVAYVNEGMLTGPRFIRKNIGYATLAEAVAEVDNDETVTMLKDVTLDETLVVAADKENITLDLAGKTISANIAEQLTKSFAAIKNRGTLTIKDASAEADGKISVSYAGNSFGYGVGLYTISNEGGVLNIEGGTVENTTTVDGSMYDAIDNNSTLGETVLNISGGEVVCGKYIGVRQFANNTTYDNIVNVTGGKVVGGNTSIWMQNPGSNQPKATISISGADYENGNYPVIEGRLLAGESTGFNFEVTGGLFDTDVNAFCAENYASYNFGDGTWGVESLYIDEFIIDDAEAEDYTFDSEKIVGTLTYKRTLVEDAWNPLYVPFALPMSELIDNYDVAYYNDVHAFDDDNDGTYERTTIELIKVADPNKVLKANYPLIIRPKSADVKNLELTLTDVTLSKAIENKIYMKSASHDFEIMGTYTKRESLVYTESVTQYVLGREKETGLPKWITTTKSLNPYRLILTVTSRGNVDLPFQAISMRIVGEETEDGTTFIYDVEMDSEQTVNYIYDLQGRRVLEPQKGGLYIVNGKKVIF